MADQPSPFQFEDIPLEDARRMGWGPRMEPMLYETLRQKLQSLSGEAVRIHLGPEIRPERMKNQIPPDLVAKFQAIDIAEVILWLGLRLRVMYQQEIKGWAAFTL